MTDFPGWAGETDETVAIVGGGIGGLASACYLAEAGADVTVFEKNEQLGGRAATFERDGFRFDMGPSWYLMPDVYERFFADIGERVADRYALTHLDPHYRIFWKDGDRLDIAADIETNAAAVERYEPGAGAALEQYLADAERQYEIGMQHFVYEDRRRLRDYLDLDVARHARGISLLGSMQAHVGTYVDHPKLKQLFQYSLVFLGGAPEMTPALYSLMSHVDFNLGVHYPDGGFGTVVDAIADAGADRGVKYVRNAPVERIARSNGNVTVRTAHGDQFGADSVVSNADYAHTETELLPRDQRQYDEAYWTGRTWAPSAFLLYLGVEGSVEPLAHHTLVLPTDWAPHFEAIFERPAWPRDPAYYVCVPSRTDATVAPDGHESLFILVPVAPGLRDTDGIRTSFRDHVLADLAEATGVDLRDRIVLERTFCIRDFAERYNSHSGTALGLAHTLRQTALFRPRRVSSTCPGLYYTGADTTPGIGVPMCLISGRHTARVICEDA